MDRRVAIPVLNARMGLNTSTMVLPEAVPARESLPQPGTSTAMAGPDLSPVIAPLSPLSSEVEMHAPSDVTAERLSEASRTC